MRKLVFTVFSVNTRHRGHWNQAVSAFSVLHWPWDGYPWYSLDIPAGELALAFRGAFTSPMLCPRRQPLNIGVHSPGKQTRAYLMVQDTVEWPWGHKSRRADPVHSFLSCGVMGDGKIPFLPHPLASGSGERGGPAVISVSKLGLTLNNTASACNLGSTVELPLLWEHRYYVNNRADPITTPICLLWQSGKRAL